VGETPKTEAEPQQAAELTSGLVCQL